jgi:4-hydroxy-tetrahydrodipicolinate synthase
MKSIKEIPAALPGVFAALVTPFAADGSPSFEAMDAVVDFALEKGVTGFCLGGATGEYPACSVEHRLQVIERVAARAKGRARLICAIGAEHAGQVRRLARAAADQGAVALLLPPPTFLPYSQEDLADFMAQVSADLPLPVLIYNIPQCTRDMGISNILKLVSTVPNIIGLKDSSGQRANLKEIQAALAEGPMAFLIGSDDLHLEAFEHGAVGTISGIAGACPDLVLPLYRAFHAGDKALSRTLQDRIDEYIRQFSSVSLTSPWAMKLSLEVQGVNSGALAWPMSPAFQERAQRFQNWLRGHFQNFAQQTNG